MIAFFNEMTPEQMGRAGGKGRSLAKLAQAGFPVPEGFVLFPEAFEDGVLPSDAAAALLGALRRLRRGIEPVAVRSSAMAEDSEGASFAGGFETVLELREESEVIDAVRHVFDSRDGERAKAYGDARGVGGEHEMAVVIQLMVPADIAGVLFTADPVTSDICTMVGNFVEGLGEKLVSGEADAHSFRLARPGGDFDGPPEVRQVATKLFRLALRVERAFGCPQDIEWAVAGRKVYLLQSRPITTMRAEDPATRIHNDALRGDYLWTATNAGEAMPDVMTPLTYSTIERTLPHYVPFEFPENFPIAGNICGRFYINYTFAVGMRTAFGINKDEVLRQVQETLGIIPEGGEVPDLPIGRGHLFKYVLPGVLRSLPEQRRRVKSADEFASLLPAKVESLLRQIAGSRTGPDLADLWRDEIDSLHQEGAAMLGATTSAFMDQLPPMREKLAKRVGEEDANTLLSSFSHAGSPLASLGMSIGLARVMRGEMTREQWLSEHGHRGPHEGELSMPRPMEDPEWLERELASYREAGDDAEALLERHGLAWEEAFARLAERYPWRAAGLKKKIEAIGTAAAKRENTRSEVIRFGRVLRGFALRAGELMEVGEDAFFLSVDELLSLLRGDSGVLEAIPKRRANYDAQRAAGPYPAFIRGRFDLAAWSEREDRRFDLADARRPSVAGDVGDPRIITGIPGASGVVDGRARVLDSAEAGASLKHGEILVAVTTNVGWTPLFPRAAAVITDVGAPLSHAAIVARELGIPAVVSCGDATRRLKTGDRIRVDGAAGRVELLESLPDTPEEQPPATA